MRHTLVWLFALFLVWGGWVYLYSRPRFWRWLTLASKETNAWAYSLYNHSKNAQQMRNQAAAYKREQYGRGDFRLANKPIVQQSTEPLPDSDNVIDAIRYFLQKGRWGGA